MRRTVVPRETGTTAVRPLLLAAPADTPADRVAAFLTAFGERLTLVRDLSAMGASATDRRPAGDCAPLAIGLFPLDAMREQCAFERAARAHGISTLSVAVERNVLLIGPITAPDAAGCGSCARLRMLGARAARGADEDREWHTCRVEWLPYLTQEIDAASKNARTPRRFHHHVVAVDTASGSRRRHRFVPLPYCDVCGGAAAIRRSRSTRGLNGWVDPLTGVVAAVAAESVTDTGLESPIVVTAAPPHLVSADGAVRRLPVGWGKGFSGAEAVLSAVGEAIERYSASLPDRSKTTETRAADLDGAVLDPRQFALYSREQYARAGFPFAPYDASLRHPWVRGHSLSTAEPTWVHAAFVHLSLKLRPHQLIVQGSSNGLAASTSVDDAARRATLELVERDALMCAWMTAAPGRRVILDNHLDPRLRAIIAGVERLGGVVELYLLDTSVIGTTALCLSMGDGRDWPGVTLALGADLNPLAAIRSAILELGQTGPHLRRLLRHQTWPIPSDEHAVRDMLDHAAFFFPVERQHHFDGLRQGSRSVSVADLQTAVETEGDLATLRAELVAAGIGVILVDVTSPDVRTGPFRVVRAISPDLQSISYGFGFDRLPVRRIRDTHVERPGSVHPVW